MFEKFSTADASTPEGIDVAGDDAVPDDTTEVAFAVDIIIASVNPPRRTYRPTEPAQ